MPLTHICNPCGHDLTWIRATPDPHYGLPVVVCPQCNAACTRRKPPIVAPIRAVKAAIRTAVVLIAEILMLTLLAGISMGLIRGFADDARAPRNALSIIGDIITGNLDDNIFVRDPEFIGYMLFVLVVISIGAGVWIRSAHGHLRLHTAILGWMGLLLGMIAWSFIIEIAPAALYGRSVLHTSLYNQLAAAGVFFLFTLPFFAIGLPLGGRIRAIWIRQFTARKHKHRKKLRKARMNHARPTTT